VNEIVDAILTWNPPFREENQCDFPELGFCQLLGRTMSWPFLGWTQVSPSPVMLHHTWIASFITPRLGSIQYHPKQIMQTVEIK